MLTEEFIAALPQVDEDELTDTAVHAGEIASVLGERDPTAAALLRQIEDVSWRELRRREDARKGRRAQRARA